MILYILKLHLQLIPIVITFTGINAPNTFDIPVLKESYRFIRIHQLISLFILFHWYKRGRQLHIVNRIFLHTFRSIVLYDLSHTKINSQTRTRIYRAALSALAFLFIIRILLFLGIVGIHNAILAVIQRRITKFIAIFILCYNRTQRSPRFCLVRQTFLLLLRLCPGSFVLFCVLLLRVPRRRLLFIL